MDLELIVWILVFVGGYVAALAYLLRIALKSRDDTGGDPSTRDDVGPVAAP